MRRLGAPRSAGPAAFLRFRRAAPGIDFPAMALIARMVVLVALAVVVAGGPMLAQAMTQSGSQSGSQSRSVTNLGSPRPPEAIDRLLGQLRQAENEAAAKAAEQAVWNAWMRSGSPTVDLLVQQAEKAIADRQYRVAISILSTAIELEPEFPEVYNRRATAYYLSRQFDLALADAEQTLELEPRHFAALAGLGVIYREMGDQRAALEAFRRALAIHPFLSAARRGVRDLELAVEQDI
jgi:tetratricopeptide (TPR) repeat protein